MRSRRSLLVPFLVVAVAVAVVGPLGSVGRGTPGFFAPPSAITGAEPGASAVRGGVSTAASPLAGERSLAPSGTISTDIVPVPSGARAVSPSQGASVEVALTLAPAHPAELAAFLAAVEEPSSPLYRQYLTFSEYTARFAPANATASSVVRALAEAGGRAISVAPGRAAVTATLHPAAILQLFGVRLVEYAHSGSMPLYIAVGTPSLSSALRGKVVGIDGLSDAANPWLSVELTASPLRPWSSEKSGGEFVINYTSGDQWFVGSDFTQAFGATGLFPGTGSVPNATFPTRVAVATLGAGGFNQSTARDLPPWDPAVVDAYFNGTLPSTWPHPTVVGAPVTIGSLTPPPPGPFGGLNDSSLDEVENSLDVEMAGSLAPGASVYNFYFAGSLLAGPTPFGSIAEYFAQSLSEALAFNYGPTRLAAVSVSYGLPDLNDSFWNAELSVAAATGVTVVAASGDQGNAPDHLTGRPDGQWPVWPASSAFSTDGVIAVGGVSLTLSGAPTGTYNGGSLNLSFDASVGGPTSLSAWYDTFGGPGAYAGTEGGISSVYPEPTWQFRSAAQWPIVNATVIQGASTLGRAEPDVAFPANDTIATVFANATGTIFFTVLGGTSVAAPAFAGVLADVVAVNSARSPSGWAPLGFLDPELYRIGSYYDAYPNAPGDPFEDVTRGHNYVFAAGPGWDPTTGWGTVEASLLLTAHDNLTVSGYVYAGPTPVLPNPPPPSSQVPTVYVGIVAGIAVVTAVVVVLAMGRPKRSRGAPTIPFGAQGGSFAGFGPGVQGNIYPGATFLCPYCGAVRPAEPVRCPTCGAF